MAQTKGKSQIKKSLKSKAIKIPTMMYVGPTLRGNIMLMEFTVYRGGYCSRIKGILETHPELKKMFIPITKVAAVREEMKKTKSTFRADYNALKKLK